MSRFMDFAFGLTEENEEYRNRTCHAFRVNGTATRRRATEKHKHSLTGAMDPFSYTVVKQIIFKKKESLRDIFLLSF
jgi:hypothetical protein